MRIITIIITIITVSIAALAIKPVREKAGEVFLSLIDYQFSKEESERIEKMERHEVVRGKDTAYIWNKHYEVWSQSGDKYFGIETAETSGVLLLKAYLIDVYKEQFYVVAEDGYAVVDRDNFCRMFLLTDAEKIESKYIEYLDSYQEYSEEEQKHFSKMITKQKVDLYK